ncbi:signal peptidase I [Lentzea sp. NPDC060358]|uniref:signal peptidase I n=1 Tax=Lentzea sp. NPDC060358 TaxID=3347103 RepID=UPI00365B8174
MTLTTNEKPAAAQRSARQVVSGVLLAVLALTAIAGAVVVVLARIGFSPVLSPSMEPEFAPGDLLVTRAVPVSELRVGDVVVLPRPDVAGQRYAHRVIDLQTRSGEPVVRTKGDANESADPQALRITSPTVPVAVANVPVVGRIALLGRDTGVRIALIVVIGGLVLVGAKRLFYRDAR